jgi:hypothetical protein
MPCYHGNPDVRPESFLTEHHDHLCGHCDNILYSPSDPDGPCYCCGAMAAEHGVPGVCNYKRGSK